MSTKPTYEELEKALLHLDDAWSDLFGQACSNPITNAWGQKINFTKINDFREMASGVVHHVKVAKKLEAPKVHLALQTYLSDEDNSHSFKDTVLDYFVKQEQRRQSKNCPEVQEWQEIANEVEEGLDSRPVLEVVEAIFYALSKASKGEAR